MEKATTLTSKVDIQFSRMTKKEKHPKNGEISMMAFLFLLKGPANSPSHEDKAD